jgi:hypothetical protein
LLRLHRFARWEEVIPGAAILRGKGQAGEKVGGCVGAVFGLLGERHDYCGHKKSERTTKHGYGAIQSPSGEPSF